MDMVMTLSEQCRRDTYLEAKTQYRLVLWWLYSLRRVKGTLLHGVPAVYIVFPSPILLLWKLTYDLLNS